MNKKGLPPIPEKLRFRYEPWGLATNVIDITFDGKVLIGHFGYWEGTRIPTKEEWKEFRASLDNCGVWNWKGRYAPKGDEPICDGTPWSLWIKWGDKVKRCSGDGEFPETFDRFERAVKRLISKG